MMGLDPARFQFTGTILARYIHSARKEREVKTASIVGLVYLPDLATVESERNRQGR